MSVVENEQEGPAGHEAGLRRDIRMLGLLFAGVGAIIGSG